VGVILMVGMGVDVILMVGMGVNVIRGVAIGEGTTARVGGTPVGVAVNPGVGERATDMVAWTGGGGVLLG